MVIPDWLLEILVCPERKDLRLRYVHGEALNALNRRIEAGEVQAQNGAAVQEPLTAALLREDGEVLYPVRDGIPVLLIEERIPLKPGDVS